jgi:hypothetical protein
MIKHRMHAHRAPSLFRRLLLLAVGISPFVGLSLAQVESSRLDQVIAPAFHQVNYEDPRTLSELWLIYAYHDVGPRHGARLMASAAGA